MKGINPIISIIVLLLITISLAGAVYLVFLPFITIINDDTILCKMLAENRSGEFRDLSHMWGCRIEFCECESFEMLDCETPVNVTISSREGWEIGDGIICRVIPWEKDCNCWTESWRIVR